jgi:hypothetical protein
MDETKQYKTAGSFRAALEVRLQTRARDEKTDLQPRAGVPENPMVSSAVLYPLS